MRGEFPGAKAGPSDLRSSGVRFVLPEPSAFITHTHGPLSDGRSQASCVNAIRLPSGDHCGAYSLDADSLVRSVSPLPSTPITQMSAAASLRRKASFFPSGENAGYLSLSPALVTRRGAVLPLAGATQRSRPWANATRRPSGEKAGSICRAAELVTSDANAPPSALIKPMPFLEAVLSNAIFPFGPGKLACAVGAAQSITRAATSATGGRQGMRGLLRLLDVPQR